MSMTTKEEYKSNTMAAAFYADDGIDIKKIVEILYRHIWIILAVGCCTFFIAFLYTFTVKPQYIASTLIQINTPSSSNMMSNPLLKDSQSTNQVQLALLKTRYVLEPLVIENGLNITVTPKYFPIFGERKARHHTSKNLAQAFLGLKSYAWGGEQISIKRFIVPSTMIGENFKLIADKKDSYKLYSSNGKLILTGKVGVLSGNQYGVTLDIATLKAHPGTEFSVSYQSPVSIAQSLGRSIRINNVSGTDPTISTGISEIQLVSGDPAYAVNMLNQVVNFAVIRNTRQKAIEAQKTLDFLNIKLPEVNNSLKKIEDVITQYHSKKGFSTGIATQTLTQRWMSMTQSLELLKSQREELLQIYTSQHPLVISLEFKMKMIEKGLDDIQDKIKKLPSEKLEEFRLDRELKIKNLLFNSLYTQRQQLELAEASLVSDIRVLTDATPAVQMPSYRLLTMLFGLLAGMFAASITLLIKNIFVKTVENADQLESAIRLPVQTILPFSRTQKDLERSYAKSSLATSPLILAKHDPEDITIESLRSLQVNLHITNSSSNQVIALMGSMSNIGKSFVSLNLAQVIAESGKKTLLIDADVRRGRLHKTLLQSKVNGLSEHLEGIVDYAGLVRPIHENLFFIPCGNYTSQPIELFRSVRFKELIEQVRKEFDHIIIDTPPILPVTDSVLIAQHCDTKLFVVSAGGDTLKDVIHAVKKATTNKIEISAIILNYRKPLTPYGSRERYRYSYKAIA